MPGYIPPTFPSQTRSNASPQVDNHPDDHNRTGVALRTISDAVEQHDYQVVASFSTDAARDAAIPSPVNGQLAYTRDTDILWCYSAGWNALLRTGTDPTTIQLAPVSTAGDGSTYGQGLIAITSDRWSVSQGGLASFDNAVLAAQVRLDGAATGSAGSIAAPAWSITSTGDANLVSLSTSGTGTSSVVFNGGVKVPGLQTGSGSDVQRNNTTDALVVVSSSKRYKTDIRTDAGDRLADVALALVPVIYRDRDDLDELDAVPGEQFGLIAEDVDDVAPELVVRRDIDELGNVPDSVSYARVVAPLLALCQRQQRQLDELAARVATLEAALLDGSTG